MTLLRENIDFGKAKETVLTQWTHSLQILLYFFLFFQVKSNPGCRLGEVTVFYSFSFIFFFLYVRTGKWGLVY